MIGQNLEHSQRFRLRGDLALLFQFGQCSQYDAACVRIGQGRENAKQYLKDNTETCDRLEAAIRSRTDAVAEEMMAGPDADLDD